MQGDIDSVAAPTFADYLRVLRRRAWVIAAATLLAVAVTMLVVALTKPRYESSAQVLLSRDSPAAVLTDTTGANDAGDPERFTQTQLQIAQSASLARRVLARAGVRDRTPADLQEQTQAVVPATTDVLVFRVQDGDRALSARLADTYAREFTVYQRELDLAAFDQALRDVSAKLAALRRAGQTQTALYKGLSEKEQQLQTLQPLETGKAVVLAPSMRSVQVRPAPKRDLVVALAAGLLLGALLAFVVDAVDRRVYRIDRLAEQLGSPVLGHVPRPSRLRRAGRAPIVARRNDGATDAYQVLRAHLERSLQAAGLELPGASVMLTAPRRGADTSTVVANLGVALTLADRSVILVEGDEHSRLHRIFREPSGPGLIDVVHSEAALADAVLLSPAGYDQLALLRLGRPANAYGGILASGELEFVLDRLRGEADIVLVDAPALADGRGALQIARNVDAFAMVVSPGAVRARMLPALRATLAEAPALDLGLIAIGGPPDVAFDRPAGRLAPVPPASSVGDRSEQATPRARPVPAGRRVPKS